MTVLRGPALAVDASGVLANLLAYYRYPAGHAARRARRRRQPYTNREIGYHVLARWLSHQWSALTLEQQLTWSDVAEQLRTANYQAYLSHNLQRWTARLAPTQTYPATETGTASRPTTWSASGGPRHAKAAATGAGDPDQWALLYFWLPLYVPTNLTGHLFAAQAADDYPTPAWRTRVLDPGFYRLRCYPSTTTGAWGTPTTPRTCPITG